MSHAFNGITSKTSFLINGTINRCIPLHPRTSHRLSPLTGGFNALSMFELIMDMGVGDTIDETPGERWDRSSGENRYDPFGRGGRDRSRRKKRHRESGGGDFSERGGGGVLVKGNYRGPSVDRDGASEGAAILPSAGTGDQLFAGGGRKGMNELLLIHNIVRYGSGSIVVPGVLSILRFHRKNGVLSFELPP